MGRQREHDWFRAEIAYTTALKYYSLKEVANEFDIPYQSVRRYASKYQWQRKHAHFLCVIKHATRLKVAEKMYGLTIDDILESNPHNVTFVDLAYCFCREFEIEQEE